MNALKSHTTFLRPSSRPSSPAPPASSSRPDSAALDRVARPLNRLSLTNFRRPSPAPPSVPSPQAAAPLVQDGSYLEMLSLKLSEAVTKALAQPVGPTSVNEQVQGRRPIPGGRARTLGKLIASEVKAAQENTQISRALMRSLLRPLTVLLSTLSAQLSPLLSTSAALALPTVQAPNANAVQSHVMGITTFAGELLEAFDQLGLGLDSDVRGDGLKPVRDGLASLVTRGLNTIIPAIRNDLMPLLDALETPAPAFNGIGPKNGPVIRSHHNHPSITILQAIVPVYSKVLARYTSTAYAQKQLATLLISIVWRGLVALAYRPQPVEPTPPSSPPMNGVVVPKKRRGSPSTSSTTPPLTPPPGIFTMKLPPSRPPSPPAAVFLSPLAADAKALFDILAQLPRPHGESENVRLAREAVDEAFDALKPLASFIELLHTIAPSGFAISNPRVDAGLQKQLDDITEDIPTVICLPCFLRGGPSVPQILGLSDSDYRHGCMSGFGRANECGDAVAQRVLEFLNARHEGNTPLARWLEMELVPSDDEVEM